MSKETIIRTRTVRMLADKITPVSIYLKIRDLFPKAVLLESSDYHSNENSYSFICFRPVAGFEVKDNSVKTSFPDGSTFTSELKSKDDLMMRFNSFIKSFSITNTDGEPPVNGLFGYMSYDSVRYFDKITLTSPPDNDVEIPAICYSFYQYIIAVNHFQNLLYITENQINDAASEIDYVRSVILSSNVAVYPFQIVEKESSTISDDQYKEMVSRGKQHCFRGDVFQIVLSRRFSCSFAGDEFNVYRALRSINPSPYLFYFDYGSFRIFGSSPEAHLKIKNNKAILNPIAGTFKRTGNDEYDKQLALRLAADPKENAEHIMLVDLARNDLSRNAKNVCVESLKQIQFYSHVIHIVSTVSAEISADSDIINLIASTFPAGTLTGAPKYKAIQLIDQYEKNLRGYYGGALGFIGLNGYLNHAIMIRTYLSKGNRIYYQAGAGIVADSIEENELNEVGNKIAALRSALEMASDLN